MYKSFTSSKIISGIDKNNSIIPIKIKNILAKYYYLHHELLNQKHSQALNQFLNE